MHRFALLLLAVLLAVPAAHAQWETVHGFAPRSTLRFPFVAVGPRVSFATPDSVFASVDGGQTFAGRNLRADLGLDRGSPPYGGGVWDDDVVLGGVCPEQCLTRLTDGQTWARVPIPASGPATVYGLAVGVAGAGSVLVVATVPATGSGDQTALWRSTDGGASWGYAQTASIPYAPNHLFVVGGRFFLIANAATNTYTGSLYTSADGDTWVEAVYPILGGTSPMDRVDTVVESGGALFTNSSAGLHRSDDGGATWQKVVTNLSPGGDGFVTSLVGLGGALAGTHQGSHVRSADGGATWTAMLCGLYGRGFPSDDFEGSDAFLFTRAGGEIGRTSYASCGLASPVETDAPAASPGLTLTLVPNPAFDSARLGVTLPEAGAVHVTLHDALGRSVRALDRTLSGGSQTLALDTSGLAPGVYVVRLVTRAGVASRTLTLTR